MTPQQRIVRELVGLECSQISNPHGSILTVDLGPLSVADESDYQDLRQGLRQLTIYSPWRVESPQDVVFDWNVDGGPDGLLRKAIQSLVGHTIEYAETRGPAWDLEIRWSGGLRLVVFGDCTNSRDTAWFVLGTDGAEVSADPIVRRPE